MLLLPRGNSPTKVKTMHMRYTLLLATRLALTGIGLSLPLSIHAAELAQQQYNIAAGPLAAQLQTLARQAGIRLTLEPGAVSGNGPALHGSHSVQQALDRLLAGSELAANLRADGSYHIDHQRSTLPTVTVTAEKINRSQRDTSTAVTVVQNAAALTMHSLYDTATLAPNTVHNESGIPNIRGITGSGPATGYNALESGARPRVSTTIDGVAESWAGQRYMNATLWDVEQVEILRGPQSTTQGRNAIAGAIVAKTRDPVFDWEGALRTGYESLEKRSTLAGMVSGPLLEDELAFRLTAEQSKSTSFIDYRLANLPFDARAAEYQGVRGKLLWQPKSLPGFTAKLTLSHRNNEGAYLNRVDSSHIGDYVMSSAGTRNTRIQDSHNTTVSTDIGYQINDALSTQWLLSHSNDQSKFLESSAERFNLDQQEDSNTLEGRLIYDPASGPFRGTLGVYSYTRHQDLVISPNSFVGNDKVRTHALYGESTLSLNPQFDLLLGARVEREAQKRDVTAYYGSVKTDIAETLFLPKVGLNYKLSEQTVIGLSARRGYTPGAGALDEDDKFYEYGKEEVTTYELSSRSSLFDQRLNLNGNLFYNEYTDLQDMVGGRLKNIPKGVSYGLELEATALLRRGLEVSASLGLLHSEIKTSLPGNPELVGNEFSQAPNTTFALGFKQQLASGMFFGAEARHVGAYASGVSADPKYRAGDYTVLNANVGYKQPRYTVRGYVNNLLNEEIVYSRRGNSRFQYAEVGAPRTVGVTVDYRFY